MTTRNKPNSITRRAVIGGGIVCGLASARSPRALAASLLPIAAAEGGDFVSELFVFPGSDPATTAIALTMPPGARTSEVRIHAGARDWSFDTVGKNAYSFPVFVGKIAVESNSIFPVREAVVIQTPDNILKGIERTGVWAEIFPENGKRRRAGSPFIAALLEDDVRLAETYHSLCPEHDGGVLLHGVARLIANRARGNTHIADALSYGFRLASRLLPDAMPYDPRLPQGFSFAARNGRHPGEDVAAIVATTLNGSPVSGAAGARSTPIATFPYFRLPPPA